MVVASLIDYNLLLKFRRIFYLMIVVLLGLVLVPALETPSAALPAGS